jgi:hypothetical protein
MRQLLVPAILVVSLAGCDAAGGVSFRFEVREEASGDPVPDALVRMFWFDDPDDVLGQGPVEETAKSVGEERRNRPSWGVTQKNWKETRTDSSGCAGFRGATFYAGALTLPIQNLLFGAREEDPTGVWIRVHPGGQPSSPYQEFLIMDGSDGPQVMRIRWDGKQSPEATTPVGAVLRIQVGKELENHAWRVVIPIER